MTEAEWHSATPSAILTAVAPTLSERKARLLAAAIAGLILQRHSETQRQLLANDPETRPTWETLDVAEEAVDALTRFADGQVSAKRLRRSLQRLQSLRSHWAHGVRWIRDVVSEAVESPPEVNRLLWLFREDIKILAGNPVTGLLLEIVGDSFHRVPFSSGWRTEDVLGLARGVSEDRAFDRMPLLADALMDAGCDDDQIISHCRTGGPHVRGCWVVDLVLGKR
jgi:hypothetical protein